MIDRVTTAACALILGTALAGCAESRKGSFPSLGIRATEAQGFEEPALAAPAVAAADPALDARLATVATTFGGTQRAFDAPAASAATRTAAAKGAAQGSEPWLNAQMALGDLDVIRAAASEIVTTLDELAADRAVAGLPPYPALDTAADDGRGTLAAMSARIATLQSRVAR